MGQEIPFEADDGEDVIIEVSYDTIFEVLDDVFIEDYGFDKDLHNREMIAKVIEDFKLKDITVDEIIENSKTKEELLDYLDIEWEIYEAYFDDNIEVIKEYVIDNDTDGYEEIMSEHDSKDQGDGFCSQDEWLAWRNR